MLNFLSIGNPSILGSALTNGILIALLVIMVVVLIVLPMFTNKRRNKAVNELHNSLRPGDVIKTVGGIVGTIVAIEDISPVDKQMTIETGIGDTKSTLVFDVQAVYQVISKTAAPAAETPAVTEPQKADDAPVAAPESDAQSEKQPLDPVLETSPTEDAKSEETATVSDAQTAPAEEVPVVKKAGAKKAGSSKK